MLYMVYNVIFTSVPPVVYAALERDVSLKSMEEQTELFDFDGNKDSLQSYWRFLASLGIGAIHALIAFFIPYGALPPASSANGRQIGLKEFGTTVYHCVVTLVNLEIALMSSYWTWLHHLFYWLSIAVCPIATLVIDAMRLSPDMAGTTLPLFGSAFFWFSIFATSIFGMMISLARRAFENARDTPTMRVRWAESRRRREGADAMELIDPEPE
jgi:magnesium-transporting ATPase (P-type)